MSTNHRDADDQPDDEGFLSRWSRRKSAAREEAERDLTAPAPPEAVEPVGEDHVVVALAEDGAATGPEERSPDLPPVETLDENSDYTAFLRQGVPEDLKREALRRAWVSDPKIADFRGFADYDWDYNAPGYGALRLSDNIGSMLDKILPREAEAKPEPEAKPLEDKALLTAKNPASPDPGDPLADVTLESIIPAEIPPAAICASETSTDDPASPRSDPPKNPPLGSQADKV